MNTIKIAVDGPSGSGKSTLSRLAAEKLGYVYVDTGAMYRTIGLYVYRKGVDPKDETAVSRLLPEIEIDIRFSDGEQLIFLNGENVSKEIRTHVISSYASAVALLPAVRAALLDRQRVLAEKNNVIMDGRDISTVVLPNANVKIFLTASPEVRANRRMLELQKRGENIPFEKILQDVKDRDLQDSSRKIAPLKPSEESIIIDTSDLSFDESLEKILTAIKENL